VGQFESTVQLTTNLASSGYGRKNCQAERFHLLALILGDKSLVDGASLLGSNFRMAH
jgi:hypothetical protein